MLPNVALFFLFWLIIATSASHHKRLTTLSASCNDGHSIETSRLDPEPLICCPIGYGLGGWGHPLLAEFTLTAKEGPICCPNNLIPVQCNDENNDQRRRPDNVRGCWFKHRQINTTNIQGRFVCAQPGVDIPIPASVGKREACNINTGSMDSDRFVGGQVLKAVCLDDENGSHAVSAVGRETTDALNTICCPQDYPQGGWSEAGEPVCCSKLNEHIVDCGGKFTYHVPAKSVIDCHRVGNSMILYGNTSVCEGRSRQQSRPKVYAQPKPNMPIATPDNLTKSSESPNGKRQTTAAMEELDNGFCLKHPGSRVCCGTPDSSHSSRTSLPSSLLGRSGVQTANTTSPPASFSRPLEDSTDLKIDICYPDGWSEPTWPDNGKPICCFAECTLPYQRDPVALSSCGGRMSMQNRKSISICKKSSSGCGSSSLNVGGWYVVGLMMLRVAAFDQGW